jgi:hypothetical protein
MINFVENNDKDKIATQLPVIDGLKLELDAIFGEVKDGAYSSTGENRTYKSDSNQLIENIFKLCTANYIIGKLDKKKVNAAERGIDPKKMRGYILQVRDYLEFRAYIKNKLENEIHSNNV